MVNFVEKLEDNIVNMLCNSDGKVVMEKNKNYTFPYKSTLFLHLFQTKATNKSTMFFNDSPLLKRSFTHYPHSLLLLLLKI